MNNRKIIEHIVSKEDIEEEEKEENENTGMTAFIRLLNAVLDGGLVAAITAHCMFFLYTWIVG